MGNNVFGGSRLRGRLAPPIPPTPPLPPVELPPPNILPPPTDGGAASGGDWNVDLPRGGGGIGNIPITGPISDMISGGRTGGNMYQTEGVEALQRRPRAKEIISDRRNMEVAPRGIQRQPSQKGGLISGMVDRPQTNEFQKLRMF